MSEYMVGEVVKAGGVETTNPGEADDGHWRAEYRGFRLWWAEWGTRLHVARVKDFDRWANSRLYGDEAPTTMEALDALLDRLAESTIDPRLEAFKTAARALLDAETRREESGR